MRLGEKARKWKINFPVRGGLSHKNINFVA